MHLTGGGVSPFKMAAADYLVSDNDGMAYRELQSEDMKTGHYGRQWFGMISILRPLFVLFTLQEIRVISQVVFLMLLVFTAFKLSDKVNRKCAIAFSIAIIFGNLEIVPIALSVSASYYIVLVSTIIAVYIYARDVPLCSMQMFLFCVGAVTPYLDFWVIPVMTYLFMMIVLLVIDYEKERCSTLKDFIYRIITGSISWLAGVFILWLMKWIIASIVTGDNIILNAINEITGWSYQRFPEWGPQNTPDLIKETLKLAFINIFPVNIFYTIKVRFGIKVLSGILIPIIILFAVKLFRRRKKWVELKFSMILCCLTLVPYIFYIIVHSSSFNHIGSAYRVQCGAIFAIILAYLYALKDGSIENHGERKGCV